jgi:hypothetical protein
MQGINLKDTILKFHRSGKSYSEIQHALIILFPNDNVQKIAVILFFLLPKPFL